MNEAVYRITLVNGDWFVVVSEINDLLEFIKDTYSRDICTFPVVDKKYHSLTNGVAIKTDKIASIEWRGMEE